MAMEELLTVEEAGAYLKVKNPTMYKYMDRGIRGVKLAYVNVGGTRRITRAAIEAFVRDSTKAARIADSGTIDEQPKSLSLAAANLRA